MRRFLWICMVSPCLIAQPPKPAGPAAALIHDFRSAVESDSLDKASELADRLDVEVQKSYREWLIRDARERVDEVLSWLPADTESFWANQTPFTLKTTAAAAISRFESPAEGYSVDRLMALDGGTLLRSLANSTTRLVMAATRRIPVEHGYSVPRTVAISQEAVYFYFLDRTPPNLPPTNDTVRELPAWQLKAALGTNEPAVPAGAPRKTLDDTNWLVLAKPDLFILANRRELLSEVLNRMTRDAPKSRALPAALPEWKYVDRTAGFWGLRHSLAEPSKRGSETEQLTVRFDAEQQRLQLTVVAGSQLKRFGEVEFKIEHPEPGVQQLSADIKERGPWPVHFALAMLGFGVYQ